jgi:UDP-N-acetylglucosamine 2-epimerase (non-hydrolysing)
MSAATPSLAFVLGTRPEIIKLAPVIAEADRRSLDFELVHTGQHYSEIEAVLETAPPDVLVVHGDTNSTLAGALAASKMDIELAHVEAGLRSYDESMPEEVNRRLTDHVSQYCFAPTREAAGNLQREDIDTDRIHVTGNTIVDVVQAHRDVARERSESLDELGVRPGAFHLLTAHRSENVDNPERFADLLTGVDRVADATGLPVVYPVHPRAQERIESFDLQIPDRIRLIEPVDFLDFLRLEEAAALAMTDSGGIQEETCILNTPCVTLRYTTERPETVHVGSNIVAGLEPAEIVGAAERMLDKPSEWDIPFGDGEAAAAIIDELASDAKPRREAPRSVSR